MGTPEHSHSAWKDKVVLITGASDGIGASCARKFGDLGASLVLTSLPNPQFGILDSANCLQIPGDITSPEVRSNVVEQAIGKFGHVDVLINNAGVGLYGFPSSVDTELAKRMFDVNVFSLLALTQLVVPHMQSCRKGSIVNIGSVGGKVSLPWAVMYCATKWAVHCIDDSLRRELKESGIQVMKVCPGIVDTKFRDHVLGGNAPTQVQDIRRVVTPDQVAAAIVKGLESRKRTVYVPKIGFLFCSLESFAPRLMDRYLRSKH